MLTDRVAGNEGRSGTKAATHVSELVEAGLLEGDLSAEREGHGNADDLDGAVTLVLVEVGVAPDKPALRVAPCAVRHPRRAAVLPHGRARHVHADLLAPRKDEEGDKGEAGGGGAKGARSCGGGWDSTRCFRVPRIEAWKVFNVAPTSLKWDDSKTATST